MRTNCLLEKRIRTKLNNSYNIKEMDEDLEELLRKREEEEKAKQDDLIARGLAPNGKPKGIKNILKVHNNDDESDPPSCFESEDAYDAFEGKLIKENSPLRFELK